ncbi:NAD(P)-binding protein, partial [Candidatus Pelagibacter bacterium]
MKDFCIIGSGISGATIANSLSKKYSLDVYDKARGVGGRSSNKKLNKNESFDHGVQYISQTLFLLKILITSLLKLQLISFNRYLLIALLPFFPIILVCFLSSFLSVFKNKCFPG